MCNVCLIYECLMKFIIFSETLHKKFEHLLGNKVLSYFISILNCIITKNKKKGQTVQITFVNLYNLALVYDTQCCLVTISVYRWAMADTSLLFMY